MKLSLISILSLAGHAVAFVPSSGNGLRNVFRMSEEKVEATAVEEKVEVPEEAAPEVAPEAAPVVAASKETVPCFGATPLWKKEPIFVGENEWNLFTSKVGSAETGVFLRAAELKHGRSAMLATVGYAFHKLGLTLDKISPHEYLSVTNNVKFADLAAMKPLDAMQSLPALGTWQMFSFIALIELYELTHQKGEYIDFKDGGVATGLKPGGLTGDLGWNPLKMKVTDRRRLSELQNGRAAMFAICAWIAADTIPGSVPLLLPW